MLGDADFAPISYEGYERSLCRPSLPENNELLVDDDY